MDANGERTDYRVAKPVTQLTRKMPMIYCSVNRDLFIRPLPHKIRTLTHIGRNLEGQVTVKQIDQLLPWNWQKTV